MVFPSDDTPFARDVAFTSGISLVVDTASVYASAVAASCFRRQVFDRAATGLELSVAIESSSPVSCQRAEFEFAFGLIAEAMRSAGAAARGLTLVVDAPAIGPRHAWDLRCRFIGPGSLCFRTSQRPVCDSFWEQVWDLRTTTSVDVLSASFVLSPCRLLPAELGVSLVPGCRVQGPPGSAWVTVSVDLDAIGGVAGHIDIDELDAVVADAVAEGERLHTKARWPTARQRHDAWLNRRLAIDVSGIGSLVCRRGLDPERFAALDEMANLVRRIRDAAVAESQRIASTAGYVPALEQVDLSGALPGGRLRDGWSKRWQLAVETTAVRHRNLITMCPWSLFPSGDPDPRYVNLLPLLRFADTCTSRTAPDLGNWKFKQFRGFHQQAAAVLQQRGASHQIAVRA